MRAVLAFSVRQGWPTFPRDPRGELMRQDNKSVGSPPPVFTLESQDTSHHGEADEGYREVGCTCDRENPKATASSFSTPD